MLGCSLYGYVLSLTVLFSKSSLAGNGNESSL